jgi:two-component system, cell cycle sensor histidine kinase and response regulator CckA
LDRLRTSTAPASGSERGIRGSAALEFVEREPRVTRKAAPTGDAAKGGVEERLRASEARLRAILDNEPECVKIVSPDGRLLEMNPAGLRMLEADSAAEVIGRQLLEMVHPEDRAAYLDLHETAVRGGTGQLQFRMVGLKHTVRWMETHSVALVSEAGQNPAVLSVTRDITERKRAEAALRESEDRYRDLVEHSRDLICTHDLQGKLLSVNEAAGRLTGYSRQDLLRMTMADLLAPEARGAFGAYLQEIRATGRARGLMRIRTANGETRYWEYDNSLRTQGVPVPVVRGMAHDITEAWRAKEALRLSEAKFRRLAESNLIGVLFWSAAGEILDANDRFLDMIGYTRTDLLREGLSWRDLTPPEHSHLDDSALAEIAAAGRSAAFEKEYVRKDGSRVSVSLMASLLEDRRDQGICFVLDISDRKRTEEALRKSEAKYRALVEHISEGLVFVDRDEIVLFANPAICQMLGYSEAELLGQNADALFFRDEDQPAMAERNRRRAEGVVECYEIEVRRRCGELFWARFSVAPVADADGRFSGSMAIIADISERKQNEAALRMSEIQLRSFIEHAPVDLAMFDDKMICLAASQRWIHSYGRGLPTPVGISHYEANPDLPERWRKAHRRALAGESQHCEEDSWVRADGAEHWLRWSVDPWRDPKGAIGGIVIFVEDISARKEAQEAMLAERAFSEAMLDGLPGIFFLFDQDGGLKRWNRVLETISGYSAAELEELRPLDLFDAADHERAAAGLRKVFESGSADVEVMLVAKDGRQIPHYFSGVRFSAAGVPLCIGMGIDLTARKHLEAELQQSQKIEAIGRLAGGVAHDFNNILGVILGYGELAESGLTPGSPTREQVAEMVKAAQRAAALTRQLQAFSRKQILQPRPLDLNDLVANAHRMLGRLIGEDITLVVRPAADLATVRADPGQIDQILLNLAINARDAMPNGGTLTLETANADLDSDDHAVDRPAMRPGRYVMLAVSDTGIGMDEATQRLIFEPFFTTKAAGQGTGLGLSTVYGIVKQSGGYIWVYSEPGLGSTFKICFPRVEELPETNTPSAPLDVPLVGDETILLVEDNAALQAVTRRQLEACGYTVLLAADGEEALALAGARPEPVDLLLTDVVMPKLGGGDLARQMVALRPGLRVLFMSGYTDGAIEQHGVLEEGVALLEKPFSGAQLARAVRAVLDRSGNG